jgi:hypothetical protein
VAAFFCPNGLGTTDQAEEADRGKSRGTVPIGAPGGRPPGRLVPGVLHQDSMGALAPSGARGLHAPPGAGRELAWAPVVGTSEVPTAEDCTPEDRTCERCTAQVCLPASLKIAPLSIAPAKRPDRLQTAGPFTAAAGRRRHVGPALVTGHPSAMLPTPSERRPTHRGFWGPFICFPMEGRGPLRTFVENSSSSTQQSMGSAR